MPQLFISPVIRAINANGAPLSGAKLYFYRSGSLDLAAIYTTDALSTEHPNPVVADAGGLFEPIYLDAAIEYRVILKTSANVTIQDVDPYNVVAASLQYLVHWYFTGAPSAQQKMYAHPFTRTVTFAEDLPGAEFYVGTNPASTTVVSLQHDTDGQFGTLSVSTAGVVTVATDEKVFDDGDTLLVVAPAGATTLADFAASILGATS